MNSRFSFGTILALASTLLSPVGARAQLQEQAPARPPAPSPARDRIINKLEHIRFETVTFDGLPLSEVVNFLQDQTIKRDPEKKGVNFMINPNAMPVPNPEAPGAAPAELIDPNSVSIRIRPALLDIRLLDVLDAVVKVADHPLRYSVEDYGVVFAIGGVGPAHPEELAFDFPGGTPGEFLQAVQKQFRVDWSTVADIPKEMADVHIPKLRISQGLPVPGTGAGGHTGGQTGPLGALVSLYNQLGQQKPELGRLLVQGDLARPSVVMFVPDKASSDLPKIKVKAFSVHGIQVESLQEDIDRAKTEAADYSYRLRGPAGVRNLEGSVAFHKDTGLLVATGPESFVEMVESIVTARQPKDAAKSPVLPAK